MFRGKGGCGGGYIGMNGAAEHVGIMHMLAAVVAVTDSRFQVNWSETRD